MTVFLKIREQEIVLYPNGTFSWFLNKQEQRVLGNEDFIKKMVLVVRKNKRKHLITGSARINWEYPRDERPYPLDIDFTPRNPSKISLLTFKFVY